LPIFLTGAGISVAPRGAHTIAMLDANACSVHDALLIHCVRCDDADVATMARTAVRRHMPAFQSVLPGTGPSPNRKFAAAGIRLRRRHRFVASNTGMDLLLEALLRWRRPNGGPGLGKVATIGGARHWGSTTSWGR